MVILWTVCPCFSKSHFSVNISTLLYRIYGISVRLDTGCIVRPPPWCLSEIRFKRHVFILISCSHVSVNISSRDGPDVKLAGYEATGDPVLVLGRIPDNIRPSPVLERIQI